MPPIVERIIIIVPPLGYKPTLGWDRIGDAPLEGATIAGTLLKKASFYVEAYDLRSYKEDYHNIIARLEATDCLCLAAMPHSYIHIKNISDTARMDTNCGPIIAGGPLATSSYEILLQNTAVDYCIVGECENVLVPLINSIVRKDIPPPGVAWYEESQKIRYIPREYPTIECLENLPLPDYMLWQDKTDLASNNKPFKTICYSTIRGCPNKCSFCANLLGRVPRFIGEEKLARDFQQLSNSGVELLNINDPTFNVRESHCRIVCELASRYGLKWTCTARVNRLSKSLIRAMKDSGCITIFIGIETLDQKLLDMHSKGIKVNDIYRAIENCLTEQLPVVGFFMLGLPGETEESLRLSLEFCNKYLILPRAKFTAPYPGSRLAEVYSLRNPNLQEENLLIDLASVTNDSNDNIVFPLSNVAVPILNNIMKQFTNLARERVSKLTFGLCRYSE